jgi:hypothetical protein
MSFLQSLTFAFHFTQEEASPYRRAWSLAKIRFVANDVDRADDKSLQVAVARGVM